MSDLVLPPLLPSTGSAGNRSRRSSMRLPGVDELSTTLYGSPLLPMLSSADLRRSWVSSPVQDAATLSSSSSFSPQKREDGGQLDGSVSMMDSSSGVPHSRRSSLTSKISTDNDSINSSGGGSGSNKGISASADGDAQPAVDGEVKDEADGDDLTSSTIQVKPIELVDEEAQFNIDIAETMESLRSACHSDVTPSRCTDALKRVKTLCDARYYAKIRLRTNGTSEYLQFLFQRWKEHHNLIGLCAQTVSSYVLNDTENKILMGRSGLLPELVDALRLHASDHHTCHFLLQLAFHLCHSKVKSLPNKYLYGNTSLGGQGTKAFASQSMRKGVLSPDSNSMTHIALQQNHIFPIASPQYHQPLTPEEYQQDNRRMLTEQYKFGEVISALLLVLSKHSASDLLQETSSSKSEISLREYLIHLCKTICAFASDNFCAQCFGEHGVCQSIATVFIHLVHAQSSGQGHDEPLFSALMQVIILLAADKRTGNRLRFYQEIPQLIPALIELLHDCMRHVEKYESHNAKSFHRLLDNSGWMLLNLCLACPENIRSVQDISYAEVVLDNLLSATFIPAGVLQKLQVAFEKIFLDPKYMKVAVIAVEPDANDNDDAVVSDAVTDSDLPTQSSLEPAAESSPTLQ